MLTPPLDTASRLDFGAGGASETPTVQTMALKAWYTGAFGSDLSADAATMMADLYDGRDYRALAYAKSAGFLRYLRTGREDEFARRVIMTPGQVMKAIAEGQTFSAIKATQVESQDTFGGLTARFA